MGAGLSPRMAERIELWPVERLVPFEGNARTHGAEQLEQLKASIRQFGFTAPILVDGEAGILAGHGRLLAARELGMEQVPVVVLDHMTAEQRRAYVLADNRLAEKAGWDEQQLAAELGALLEAEFDLNAVGFSEEDLARLTDGLDLGEFEQLSQPLAPGTERAEPEQQSGLGMGLGRGDDDEDGDDGDDVIDRSVALAIVLTPEEMAQWRSAKAELGYSKDKTAFWKLVSAFLEELRNG
jgi:hypothetical protein